VGRRRLRSGVALVAMGVAFLVPGALAWACIPLATLHVSPTHVRPGQEVTISGVTASERTSPAPVDVHLDAVDGPVLATLTPDAGGQVRGTLTLPARLGGGPHQLVATQAGSPVNTPAAVLQVVPADGPARPWGATAARGPASPVHAGPTGAGLAVLATLAAAGLGLLGAGVALAAGSRSPRVPAPVPVTPAR
jgi:hypothetical protein